MAAPAGENDSIITFGLELAEATEQSVGEIAEGLGDNTQTAQAVQEQQASPDMREAAEAAWEREQAEREQELDHEHEFERDELER
jgi:hypothetical protein